MENVGSTILASLGEYVAFCCLVGRSSCFQIYCFHIVEQQTVLPRCNDNDRECLFQTEQGAQHPLTIQLTMPSLFVETFVAVFITSPICFLPINGPYTIILTVLDTVKIKHFFIGKKDSHCILFSELFSRPIGEFFPLSFMLILQ